MGKEEMHMTDRNEIVDISKEVAKELARDVYNDGGKPFVKATGELVGLVPRAIKAALAPVEKWVLQCEYNIEETKKLLEEKLKDVPPELIQPPEAHIAVPALQYISYCMDNEELRNMYANLLANSMNEVVKNGVHPGFVEIIKQLCPDEAKILRYFSTYTVIPTITLKYVNEKREWMEVVKNFSDVGELTQCEKPFEVNKYFDNLIRLGLLESSQGLVFLTDKKLYEPLKNHWYILPRTDELALQKSAYNKVEFQESFVALTDYGKSFCSICLATTKFKTVKVNP